MAAVKAALKKFAQEMKCKLSTSLIDNEMMMRNIHTPKHLGFLTSGKSCISMSNTNFDELVQNYKNQRMELVEKRTSTDLFPNIVYDYPVDTTLRFKQKQHASLNKEYTDAIAFAKIGDSKDDNGCTVINVTKFMYSVMYSVMVGQSESKENMTTKEMDMKIIKMIMNTDHEPVIPDKIQIQIDKELASHAISVLASIGDLEEALKDVQCDNKGTGGGARARRSRGGRGGPSRDARGRFVARRGR